MSIRYRWLVTQITQNTHVKNILFSATLRTQPSEFVYHHSGLSACGNEFGSKSWAGKKITCQLHSGKCGEILRKFSYDFWFSSFIVQITQQKNEENSHSRISQNFPLEFRPFFYPNKLHSLQALWQFDIIIFHFAIDTIKLIFLPSVDHGRRKPRRYSWREHGANGCHVSGNNIFLFVENKPEYFQFWPSKNRALNSPFDQAFKPEFHIHLKN